MRRLAREAGVDLADVRPSGPHGRVTPADISRVTAWSPPTPDRGRDPTSTPVPAPPSATLTTVVEVDLTQAPGDVLVFVAAAAARALAHHPVVNELGRVQAVPSNDQTGTNLALPVDLDDGTVQVVVRGADDLTVGGLTRKFEELTHRARTGTLASQDSTGATLILRNTGRLGALFDTPALDGPEPAVLGVGAVVRRPVVVVDAAGQEQLAIRSMAYLSLTYPRELGATEAARFLATVKELLQRRDGSMPGPRPR